MKKSFRVLYLFACITVISCSKSDTTEPEPAAKTPNFYIGLQNDTDDNVSCKTRQLVRLELVLSDGGANKLEEKFTLNPAQSGMYKFYIPDIASYDIKVYTNEGQYVKWKHVSLAPNEINSSSIIHIGTQSSDYIKGSILSGLVPDESTIDCN